MGTDNPTTTHSRYELIEYVDEEGGRDDEVILKATIAALPSTVKPGKRKIYKWPTISYNGTVED